MAKTFMLRNRYLNALAKLKRNIEGEIKENVHEITKMDVNRHFVLTYSRFRPVLIDMFTKTEMYYGK